MDCKEHRSSQAPRGIPTRESASSRKGGSDSSAYGPMNPSGTGGNCLLTMANSSEMLVPSGSKASGLSGVHVVVVPSSQGSGSSGGPVFSTGFTKVTGFSSTTSNMETLSRASASVWYVRHLWRSWMALQSLPGGVPDCTVHLWRTQASATILSCLTTLMSQEPRNGGRKKSPHFNPARQGGSSTSCSFPVGCWVSRRLQLVSSPGPAPPVH